MDGTGAAPGTAGGRTVTGVLLGNTQTTALDDIARDEAAARRAGQIVENILKSQTTGYMPRAQNNAGESHGKRRRRRRRGHGGGNNPSEQNARYAANRHQAPAHSNILPRSALPPVVKLVVSEAVATTVPQASCLPLTHEPSHLSEQAGESPAARENSCCSISESVSITQQSTSSASQEIQQEPIPSPELQVATVSIPVSGESGSEATPAVEPAMKPVAQSSRRLGQRRRKNQNSTAVSPQLPPDARKVVLLNSVEPGEIRVAILENGELAEIFMERKSRGQQTGNIYKGRVVNIEPSLQAAFVDLGTQRHGFLHASDCIPPNGSYNDISNLPETQKTRVKHARNAVTEEQPLATLTENQPLPQTQESGASNVEGAPSGETIDGANADVKNAQAHSSNRHRRRRRGYSGRARPPSAAPMVAPTLESESASEDSHAAPTLDQTDQTDQTDLPDTPLTAPVSARPTRRGGGRSGRERQHDRRYTIQEMLSIGQEVLVQVSKESIGQKGPALTNYISMPGRYLVLMPAMPRLGVSKRIESEEQRRTLKEILGQLNAPEDIGVIVRTAGTGHSKEDLQRDMDYLLRGWNTLKKKGAMAKAPALIYQEGDVITRVFRDVITDDVAEIIIDDSVALGRAREFLREMAPGTEHKLKLYSEPEPLFHKHGVEQQLQRLFNRKVNLRSGGSIVIEQTEALVAIDVNTGRFREKRNQDDTILQTNLEAAREIARQLRLRDIGGLVMIDFIDMDIHEHRRSVECELKAHLARDKARTNVLPISSLGVVEMTRQRIRHSLRKTLFDRCSCCSGLGQVKSPESLGLEMLREIKSQLRDSSVRRVKALLNSTAAFEILNQFRKELIKLEDLKGVTIEVRGDSAISLSQMQISTAKEGGEWVLKKTSEVDDYVRNS
ncbi:MAG: Rne/Rng family ribonuclease [Planctomycetota bacterium]